MALGAGIEECARHMQQLFKERNPQVVHHRERYAAQQHLAHEFSDAADEDHPEHGERYEQSRLGQPPVPVVDEAFEQLDERGFRRAAEKEGDDGARERQRIRPHVTKQPPVGVPAVSRHRARRRLTVALSSPWKNPRPAQPAHQGAGSPSEYASTRPGPLPPGP